MSAILDKSQMSEEDIKLRFITPALTAKWSVDQSTMETRITDGRINIRGNIAVREKSKKADYVLYLNAHTPIAIVEAKDNNHTVSFGLQQAITYATMMDIPFAYSSNGDAFYEHDFLTGQERQIALDEFPSPAELQARYYGEIHEGKGLTEKEKAVQQQPYFTSQKTYPDTRDSGSRMPFLCVRDFSRVLSLLCFTSKRKEGSQFFPTFLHAPLDPFKHPPVNTVCPERFHVGFKVLHFRSDLNRAYDRFHHDRGHTRMIERGIKIPVLPIGIKQGREQCLWCRFRV